MTKRKSLWAGIIAAGLTALLLLAVYAACGLFPCGSLSLGWGDMKQQIAPLFLQFRNFRPLFGVGPPDGVQFADAARNGRISHDFKAFFHQTRKL